MTKPTPPRKPQIIRWTDTLPRLTANDLVYDADGIPFLKAHVVAKLDQ